MKLTLHAVHFTLTDAMKDKVQEALVAPLEHFIRDEEARLEVHLCETAGSRAGDDKECRVTLHLRNQPPLHVTARSENLYKSIQQAHERTVQLAKKALARHRHHTLEGGEEAEGEAAQA